MPPAAYARAVCTSVGDWQQDVDGQTATLSRSIARQDDPTAIRATVVAYYTRLAARTDTLHGALAVAGTPDVPGGEDFAVALLGVVRDQGGALRDDAARAGRLDIADRTMFQAALLGLLTNSGTSVTQVGAALSPPTADPSTGLTAALEADPTCAPFVG